MQLQFGLHLVDQLGQRRDDTTHSMRRRASYKQLQKGRIGEASNPGPQNNTKQILVVQQINITQLDENGHHLVANDADITGIAEHKLTKSQVGPWKIVRRRQEDDGVQPQRLHEEGAASWGGSGWRRQGQSDRSANEN